MSNPTAAHSQNLYLGEPPNGAADYDRDLKQNFRIVDFIAQGKNNYVLSGLAVTAGAGLTVNWASGTAEVAGTSYSISASSGSAADNSGDTNLHLANFVFVNTSGAVVISTSLPTTEYTPLAIVFTNAGAISKVADCRKIKIVASDTVTNVTATTTNLTAAQCTGRITITNYGSSVVNECVLPAAAANLKINLLVTTGTAGSIGIKITPGAGDALIIGDTTLADAVGLTSYVKGSEWEAVSVQTGASAYDWLLKLKGVQPKIHAYASVAYTLSISAWGKILINNSFYNNNGIMALNKITPLIPGDYDVYAQVQADWSSATSNKWTSVAIYKNGALYVRGGIADVGASSSVAATDTTSAVVPIDGDDYIELYGRQDTGGTANGDITGTRTYIIVARRSD